MQFDIKNGKALSVFTLIMINIIAVDSLRTLPFSAKLGAGLVGYYLVAAIFFFLPVALVTSELATTWPEQGGVYVWVKKAFGEQFGFLVVWLQWVYNVVWYPTILSLVAGVAAFLAKPELANNSFYMFFMVVSCFWLTTLFNCFGMKLSGIVSTIGAIFGTLLPMLIIILLAYFWVASGNTSEITFNLQDMIPEIASINDAVLFSTIIFGLMGIEMSAVHAKDVNNPKRDYPLAIKVSSILILSSLVLSSLAVAVVVPNSELNVVTGMVQAFDKFFVELNLPIGTPLISLLIILGALAGVATWIIGPTKGILAAAEDDNLPSFLAKTNKYGVPVNILIIQAMLVTILALAYIFLPSIETAYLVLTELTAILALLMYVLMFLAAIKLRYSQKNVKRPYKIPFGNIGMWVVCLVGGVTSIIAIMLSAVPPSQISITNPIGYQIALFVGVISFCLPAFLIHD